MCQSLGTVEKGAMKIRLPSGKAPAIMILYQISVSAYWKNGIFPLMLQVEPVNTREVNVYWRLNVSSSRRRHIESLYVVPQI